MTDAELRRQLDAAIAALGKSETELAALRAVILDIDAHATPIGLADPGDPDGNPHHYAVTVGALHRALGKIGHTAAPCTAEAAVERVRALHATWKLSEASPNTYCAHCQQGGGLYRWPCPTITALDQPAPAATQATEPGS